MLKYVTLENFTLFQEKVTCNFAPGLNVIVGENATGKSHLIKLAYVVASASYQFYAEEKSTKKDFIELIQKKLMDVFRAEKLENLVHKRQKGTEAQVSAAFNLLGDSSFWFYFKYPFQKKAESTKLDLASKVPNNFIKTSPVFVPTREILSFSSVFNKLYTERDFLLDGTYFDLSQLLQTHSYSDSLKIVEEQNTAIQDENKEKVIYNRGLEESEKEPHKKLISLPDPLDKEIESLVSACNDLIEGTVRQDSEKFYLMQPSGVTTEMPLVAEGLRKIGMLSYLLENSSLQKKGLLIWDEPEANLNPVLIAGLAKIMVKLASLNIQVIIATHSLFLLREIQIHLNKTKTKARFFALSKDNGSVHLSQADSVEDIEPIAALDADLQQSDRYMELM